MHSIRSALALWGLEPDTARFTFHEPLGPCGDYCTHPAPKSVEDVLSFDMGTFGANCAVLSDDYLDSLEYLFSAATSIIVFENVLAQDMAEAAVFPLPAFRDYGIKGIGEGLDVLCKKIFYSRAQADLDKTFEAFKEAVAPDLQWVYDPSEPLLYVQMAEGFALNVPVLMVKALYRVIENPADLSKVVLMVPRWALDFPGPTPRAYKLWMADPNFNHLRDSPIRFAGFPVEDACPVLEGDDEEVFETLKTLSLEMRLFDAVRAARALR